MEIIGNGLIASGFMRYRDRLPDVAVFAKGVAHSVGVADGEFNREVQELVAALESSRRAGRRIVYFSSGAALFDDAETPRHEASPVNPSTPYGRHQVRCEDLVRSSGVRHLIVRLPNVVGPRGHRAQLVPSLVAQCLTGYVRVQTHATRDLIAIDDVAVMVSRVLLATVDDDLVQVASGRSHSALEIVRMVGHALDVSPRIEFVTGGERQAFDCRKLRAIVGEAARFGDSYAYETLHRYVPALALRLKRRSETV